MWVMTLSIAMLVLMLAVLAYVARAARQIETGLSTLIDDQGERLRRIERDLDRVRQAVDSVSTGVMTIDIRQRMTKQREQASAMH